MSIATYTTASAVRPGIAAKTAPARKRPGVFSRFFASLIANRQRQAVEELKRHGVKLPNELEQAGWKINERSEDSLPFVR